MDKGRELTGWFPAEIFPVHVGWYDCQLCRHRDGKGRHFWTGKKWIFDTENRPEGFGGFHWRGLQSAPKPGG